MEIEFIEIIGLVKNDSMIDGKALLFNIIDINKNINFECIMFVHPTLDPFLTIEKHININNNVLLNTILNKYTLIELRKL